MSEMAEARHVFAIPAYGDSPYLERCIRSLLRQRIPSPVILCTSTPSPRLSELAQKYGLAYYVREGKSGIGEDWNFAYEMAGAELVTIAHQDDLYHRDYTACLLRAARRYPDMTVFTTDYCIIKDGRLIQGDLMLWVKRLLRLPLRIPALGSRRLIKRLPLMFGNSICCPATTYRKSLIGEPLVRSGLQFALDWDTLLRLADQRGRFICEERPLLFYRVHDGAATSACIADRRRQREEEAMFERFWPRPLVRLIMKGYRQAYNEYQ